MSIFIILYIRSLWLICYLLPNLYAPTYHSYPAPANHHFTGFYRLTFLDSTCVIITVSAFLWPVLLNIMCSRSIHVVANGRISFLMDDLFNKSPVYGTKFVAWPYYLRFICWCFLAYCSLLHPVNLPCILCLSKKTLQILFWNIVGYK